MPRFGPQPAANNCESEGLLVVIERSQAAIPLSTSTCHLDPLCAHHGHPAEHGERSEPDIQAARLVTEMGGLQKFQPEALSGRIAPMAVVPGLRGAARKRTFGQVWRSDVCRGWITVRPLLGVESE